MNPKTATNDNSLRTQIGRDTFSPDNIRKCEDSVLKVQYQLDRAVEDDDRNKIRFLVHQLSMKSKATKIMAINRICNINTGRFTAGVDGVSTPKTRAERLEFMYDMLDTVDITRKPESIRRVYIPKPNGTKRPLGIPTIHDRIAQEIIRLSIEPICEYHFNHYSYGFRPKRSCHDAIQDIFTKYSRKISKQWVVEGDIKGCFDHISHDHIINILCDWKVPKQITSIIYNMLKSGITFDGITSPSEEGTPQGGIISPMLANVALTILDDTMQKWYGSTASPLVRYADDFIITAGNETEAIEIKGIVGRVLKDIVGMELSDDKTRITRIEEGFNFLGFNVRKFKDKLIIKPTEENIKEFRDKVRNITSQRSFTAIGLIHTLNPIILGWGYYYRHCIASQTFSVNQSFLYKRLFSWGKKKHPNGRLKWIRWQYFTTDWTFYDKETGIRLRNIENIHIIRHTKVNKDVRVYNKDDQDYWYKRENKLLNLYGRHLKLHQRQEGICPFCEGRLSSEDKAFHLHHLKPIAFGGVDELTNLRLIHRSCHVEIHNLFSLKEMSNYADKSINYFGHSRNKIYSRR
jgi:RNA-directed DNA polymerase